MKISLGTSVMLTLMVQWRFFQYWFGLGLVGIGS